MWPTQDEDVKEDIPLEYVIVSGKGYDKTNRLLDIKDARLRDMKRNNVICQIISPTASGIQSLNWKSVMYPVKKSIEVNNYIYESIKDEPKYFKAFSVLPMTHPKEAAEELERCVKDLKMVGRLLMVINYYTKMVNKKFYFMIHQNMMFYGKNLLN